MFNNLSDLFMCKKYVLFSDKNGFKSKLDLPQNFLKFNSIEKRTYVVYVLLLDKYFVTRQVPKEIGGHCHCDNIEKLLGDIPKFC